MRQFDVHENPVLTARKAMPYLVVLSSHLLPDLTEVIVAPVTRLRLKPAPVTEVAVSIRGEDLVLIPFDLSGFAARRLNRKVGSLLDHEYDIPRALDRLFTGF